MALKPNSRQLYRDLTTEAPIQSRAWRGAADQAARRVWTVPLLPGRSRRGAPAGVGRATNELGKKRRKNIKEKKGLQRDDDKYVDMNKSIPAAVCVISVTDGTTPHGVAFNKGKDLRIT